MLSGLQKVQILCLLLLLFLCAYLSLSLHPVCGKFCSRYVSFYWFACIACRTKQKSLVIRRSSFVNYLSFSATFIYLFLECFFSFFSWAEAMKQKCVFWVKIKVWHLHRQNTNAGVVVPFCALALCLEFSFIFSPSNALSQPHFPLTWLQKNLVRSMNNILSAFAHPACKSFPYHVAMTKGQRVLRKKN